MKKIVIILSACVMVFVFSLNASAHNQPSGVNYSASNNKWEIRENEKHWANSTTTMTVNWGDFSSANFKPHIDNAVSAWNNQNFNGSKLISMSESNNGAVVFKNKSNNEIKAENNGNSTWALTMFKYAVANDSNHISTSANSIEIWVNWNDVVVKLNSAGGYREKCWDHIALHELGHVIGLKDIPSSVSVNDYLMCNDFVANTPKYTITDKDKQGASTILGQHTHSFYVDSNNLATCNICYGYFKLPLVSFNANGGSVNPTNARTNTSRKLASLPTPTKTGYTFAGWYDTSATTGGTKITTSYVFNNDKTIYARWTLNTYAVSYNANGSGVSNLPANQVKTHGVALTLSSTVPKRTGYIFVGWGSASNSTNWINQPGGIYTENAPYTYYAMWKATYTISYNTTGGSGSIPSQTKTHDISLTLTNSTPTPPSGSYTITYNANGGSVSTASKSVSRVFDKWNTSSSGSGMEYAKGSTYSANASATLYAQWVMKAGTLATPTRPGYTFAGWFTSSSGGTRVVSSTKITSNMTIYARWEEYGVCRIKSISNNRYLDSYQNPSVSLYNDCGTSDPDQRWIIQKVGNAFEIRSVHNYFSGNNNIARIVNNGGSAYLSATNNSNSTGNITIQRNSDGTVTFKLGSNALTASSSSASWTTLGNSPTNAQKWVIEPYSGYKIGDVNNDGVINMDDAIQILTFVSGGNLTAVQYYVADVDRNGKAEMADVTEIQKYVAGFPSLLD